MTSSPLPPDPYSALSVPKDATIDQIRSSYRKLVLKAHPDRFPQATPEEKQKKTDEFHKIQQAYELLTDETRKLRYDERVKLAELKANLLKEQAAANRAAGRSAHSSQDYGTGRSFTVPTYETRGNAVYEERVPKPSPRKPFEEEPVSSRYESSPRYEEFRHSPRSSKHEDAYRSANRKPSARDYEDVKRSAPREERDAYDERSAAKERAKKDKERERQSQAERKKTRDKARKQDTEAKQYRSSPRVQQYTDSESSEDDHRRGAESSRKKSGETSRRSRREELPTRRSRDVDDYSDYSDERSHNEFYQRQNTREQQAWEYIKTSRKQPSDGEERPRDSLRTTSRKAPAPPPPPPPPPPSVPREKADVAKRSSATRKPSTTRVSPPRSSRKDKPAPEIIEPERPSRRSTYDSTRARPSLKSTESAPPMVDPEIRHLGKASTWQARPSSDRDRERDREREKEPRATMRRTQTTPTALQDMVNGSGTQRSSHGASKLYQSQNARDIETDSEPDTPEPNSYNKKTSYREQPRDQGPLRFTAEPEEMDGARIFKVEPTAETRRSSLRDEISPRARERVSSRETSPVGSKRPTMPGRSSASNRVPQRSSTETSSPKSSPRMPAGFQRTNSGRVEPLLYGELSKDSNRERPGAPLRSNSNTSTFYKYSDIKFAQPIDTNNIQYSSRRRETTDGDKERSGRASDRERSRERSGRGTYPSDSYASKHASSGAGRTASKASVVY